MKKRKKISPKKVMIRGYLLWLAAVLIPNPILKKEESIENSKYKIVKEYEDLDDFLTPVEEKNNLSQEAIQMLDYMNQSSYDSPYIEVLGIDSKSVTEAYSNLITEEKINHKNSKFYDEETNTIDWNGLVSQIYKNSLLEEEWLNNSLTEEEIKEKIIHLKEFTEKLKQDFPDYDLKKLACQLEEYAMFENIIQEPSLIATTNSAEMVYYPYYEQMKKKHQKQIDFHEDFHVAINNCENKNTKYDFSRVHDGINVTTPYSDEEYGLGSNNRFFFSFLNEIYAELYSCEKMDTSQTTYFCYDELLTMLQIALGLNEDYQIDQILENMIEQDPISFVQSFPVYKDEMKSFIDNLKMLKCYDMLMSPSNWYVYELKIHQLWDNYKEGGVEALYSKVEEQLSKIFFTNLVILNEKEKMSLEDNFAMLDLFDYYSSCQKAAIEKQNDIYLNIEEETFSQFREYFCNQYLEKKFKNKEPNSIMNAYYNYHSNNYVVPKIMNQEKRFYYQFLFTQKELCKEDTKEEKITNTYEIPLQLSKKR